MSSSEEKRWCHFHKLVVPSVLQQKKLQIPKKFVRKFGDQLLDVAIISIPDEVICPVKLLKTDNGIWFDSGWHEFLERCSIHVGQFLDFRYEGNSCFSVVIYDLVPYKIKDHLNSMRTPEDHHKQQHHTCNRVKEDGDSNEHKDDNSVEILDSSPSSSFSKHKAHRGQAGSVSVSEVAPSDRHDDAALKACQESASAKPKRKVSEDGKKRKRVAEGEGDNTEQKSNGITLSPAQLVQTTPAPPSLSIDDMLAFLSSAKTVNSESVPASKDKLLSPEDDIPSRQELIQAVEFLKQTVASADLFNDPSLETDFKEKLDMVVQYGSDVTVDAHQAFVNFSTCSKILKAKYSSASSALAKEGRLRAKQAKNEELIQKSKEQLCDLKAQKESISAKIEACKAKLEELETEDSSLDNSIHSTFTKATPLIEKQQLTKLALQKLGPELLAARVNLVEVAKELLEFKYKICRKSWRR